jgi:hypothetical protein
MTARQRKRKAPKERKAPIAERDDAGLRRILRLRKPSGGKVTLARYAMRNVAA